jgi:hypothetical protein
MRKFSFASLLALVLKTSRPRHLWQSGRSIERADLGLDRKKPDELLKQYDDLATVFALHRYQNVPSWQRN